MLCTHGFESHPRRKSTFLPIQTCSSISRYHEGRVQQTISVYDEVTEWLRCWTANPMCSARMGSNPILVENQPFCRFKLVPQYQHIRNERFTEQTLSVHDEVTEWLRCWTANPMCSARMGSNPILVENQPFRRFKLVPQYQDITKEGFNKLYLCMTR